MYMVIPKCTTYCQRFLNVHLVWSKINSVH